MADLTKEVGYVVLGASDTRASVIKSTGYVVLGASDTRASVIKLSAYAVIDDSPPPPVSNPNICQQYFLG